VEYRFVDEKRFHELKNRGAFLEWAEVHGNYYGTLAAEVEELRQKEYDVILEIDVQGAEQVRSAAAGEGEEAGGRVKAGGGTAAAGAAEGISVFILPPSMKELLQRIQGRGTDSAEAIQRRFAAADSELREVFKYDYAVVNDTIPQAVKEIKGIILAEKRRVQRNKQFLTDFIEKGDVS
jgi:guanylate kinase